MTARILICVLVLAASPAWALSVEEAYEWIPHQRTVFQTEKTTIPEAEREYLKAMFGIVDQAIVERVEAMQWISSKGAKGAKSNDYDLILRRLNDLKVPQGLNAVHKHVIEAVEGQRELLKEWEIAPPEDFYRIGTDPRVRSISQALRRAYVMLTIKYPKETDPNKQAFFDYLCALDFI